MSKTILTQAIIKEYFNYNSSGFLTWKKTNGNVKLGQKFGSINGRGYITGSFLNNSVSEHRLIFLLYHNYLPKHIDHKNRIKTDNSISNLREATTSQNAHNICKPITNTSGFKGVSFHKNRNKFQANIKINGKKKHLGLFLTSEEAYIAYCNAAKELHGKFACTK